ncbi:apolipoprotein N-acyltransferase [Ehrlichia sp. JZT12]
MGSISMPPFYMFIALFIALSGFYILLSQAQNIKQAFFSGLWFGIGYFTTGLYWAGIPLITQGKMLWVLLPTLIPVLMFLSLFFALAAVISYALNYKKLLGLIVFSLSFTIAGMLLESIILPWNLFAYSLSFSTEMLQIASLLGVHGTTFFVIFCSAAAGVCIQDKATFPCIIALVILVGMFMYGNDRLLKNQEQRYHHDVALRLVQGNIKPSWDANQEQEYDTFQTYLRLTSKYGLNSRTHIIWPESSFPFLTDENYTSVQNTLKFIIPRFLIAGGTRFENDKFYNTLFATNSNGEIIDYYDKCHLLPFGEFIPSILKNIVPTTITNKLNLSHGENKTKLISLNNKNPFIPLICYESVFSNEVINRSTGGQWIVNITNDSWFGISSQPYQHFEISRLRSIENGVPTIRVANSGISGIIDSYGRVIDSLPIMIEGTIDSYLPYHISEGTIYTRYLKKFINVPFVLLLMLVFLLIRVVLSKYKSHRY